MRLIEKTLLDTVQKLPIYRILIWSGNGWMRKKTPSYEGFGEGSEKDEICARLIETLTQTSVESRCVLDLPRNQLLLIDRMEKVRVWWLKCVEMDVALTVLCLIFHGRNYP